MLLAAPLLGGCVDEPSVPTGGQSSTLPGIQIPIDPAFSPFVPEASYAGNVRFTALRSGSEGAEPSIGVTSKGNVFITAGGNALRSGDGGATWETVTAPVALPRTFDPYLWVDHQTDRVFHVNLYIACSWLAYSDDEGESWTTNPAACGLPVNDHQKLASGPPAPGNPLAGVVYKNVVYYAVNQLTHTMISTSYDGGLTWIGQPAGVPLMCGAGGINGQPEVAPNGNAFVPFFDCGGLYVARSGDNGLRWEPVLVSKDAGAGHFDPDMASDAAGTTYAVWEADAKGKFGTFLSRTRDGRTWADPLKVQPDELGATIFPTIVAGDEGNLWVTYVATDDTRDDPNNAKDDVEWFLYATHITGAHTDAPVLTTYLLDPHPVQIGRICTAGIACDSARNLLEFIDSAIDPKNGRLWVVYTDGCEDGACKTKAQSTKRISAVARLDTGPSLHAGFGWLPDLA